MTMISFRCRHCGAEEIINGVLYAPQRPQRSIDELFLQPTNRPSDAQATRAYNCLANAGVTTIEVLLTKRASDLLRIKNLGRVTLAVIIRRLREHSLELGSRGDQDGAKRK